MATPFPRLHEGSRPDATADRTGRWEGRLFGAFQLVAPDGSNATPVGRKARALVAYLLANAGEGATRERLSGLLWSERGEDQARASLRQTLYEIRALTSGDAPLIAVDRARVSIDATRVTSDVARIDGSVDADDAVGLKALAGDQLHDFLADLDGIDPAFDDWLSIERTRRRDQRRRVLLAAATRMLANGDVDGVQQLADRLLSSDPTDEAAACVAMRAAHRRGDRDAVRQAFVRLQSALRKQLDVDVSRETAVLHRSLLSDPAPRDPLRIVVPNRTEEMGPAALVAGPEDQADQTVQAPDPVADDPSPRAERPVSWRESSRVRAITWMAAAVLAVVLGIDSLKPDAPLPKRTLVVDPLRASADDSAALALGVGLSAEIARLLLGNDTAFVVRDANTAIDRKFDRAFLIGADAASDHQMLHVDLKVRAEKGGPLLWSTTFVRSADEVDALREQMAAKVADVVSCALGSRNDKLGAMRADTLQLLLGACDLRRSDLAAAAKLLTQVVNQSPDFAHGWALLAAIADNDDSTINADGTPTTETYARRAIALDPHDGDAYIGRAAALPGIANWSRRVAILREGQRMDPDNADLASVLAQEFADVGYWKLATASSRRAAQADPLSPGKSTQYASLLGMGGDGPEANLAFTAALRRFSNVRSLALADFRYHALVGDHRHAALVLADPNRGFHFQPERAAMWRALIATRATPSAAHDDEAEQAFLASLRAYPGVNLPTLETLAFLHRVDEAYADAEQLSPAEIDDVDTELLFTVVTQPLRADPRFMTLAARLGLVAIWQKSDQWPDFCKDPSLPYDCRVEATRASTSDRRPLVAKQPG